MVTWQIALIDEWIHHPELDVLDVLCFKVRIVKFTHHAAPSFSRSIEMAILIDICSKIVCTSFLRIESKVQDTEACGRTVIVLRFLRIQLTLINLTNIMTGQLVEVTLNMTRSECAASTGKDGVNIIPCQKRTFVTICSIARQFAFCEHARSAGHTPIRRLRQATLNATAFEVVQIRCIALYTMVLTCY